MRGRLAQKHLLWISLLLYACGGSVEEAGGPDELAHVPRHRTLMLGDGEEPDYASVNLFMPGYDYLLHIFLYEPLYFYNAFVEKTTSSRGWPRDTSTTTTTPR